MKPSVIQNNFPLKAWKELIETHDMGSPVFVETELSNIDVDSPLFIRYYNSYKWHFRDTKRSLLDEMKRPLTQYEFSYYERIHDYFGINQTDIVSVNPNNIICTWDSKKDYENNPKPCLITIKFIQEKNFLHISTTFRMRDLIRRMYPNFIALSIFHKNHADKLNCKTGKLFDYSNQAAAKKEDLIKVKSWEEFNNFN
jgi:thymidylate synthase